jgi:gas vesicle protein
MIPNKTNSDFPPGLALLLGAAAGLTAGLLIAGKSGARLRTEIGQAVDEYRDVATNKITELRDQGSELAQKGLMQVQRAKTAATDKVKQTVNKAVNDGETDAHGAIDSTVSAVHSAAAKSHQVVSGAADAIRTGTNG